jgi:nicotinamidase-related amidase
VADPALPGDSNESNRALLVLGVSLQRFRGDDAERFQAALRYIQGEVRYFRERGRLVVFAHEGGMVPVADLTPRSDEPSIEVLHPSAFFNTSLESLLRARNVARLSIVGFDTHVGVLLSAADAAQRGFEVIVPEPCVASSNPTAHQLALDLLYKHWPQAGLMRRRVEAKGESA